jgi:hypothetical protein
MISRKANDHAFHLDAKTNVEVLRYMRVRPPLDLVIVGWICKGNILESLPTEEGVMTNEGRDIARTDTILDGSVDDVGEVGD